MKYHRRDRGCLFRRARLGALVAVLAAAAAGCPTPPPARYLGGHRFETQRPLAILGDTRRTWWPERILGREQNDPERAVIVHAVAAARPAAIVFLGDMIFFGDSASSWARFDRLMAPVRRARIPILPSLGNHEYVGSNRRALRHLRARFPALPVQKTWFVARYGPLALVILDTNPSEIGEAAWRAQRRWYARTLMRLDADPGVRGVLVFGHHPPYTNSTAHGDDKEVQRHLVPAFLGARKTLAFFAGHAHGYERFVRQGKTFVVAAGGGAPRAKLKRGEQAAYRTLYRGPVPLPFHFLLVTAEPDGARFVLKGMDKGETNVRLLETFHLPYPAGPKPAPRPPPPKRPRAK